MPKKQPIEPKPTQYGITLFRSRLEARWAVFFDFTENVINWRYEPKTFKLPNGWSYTPDFLITLSGWHRNQPKVERFYMEVKPKPPTAEYRKMLGKYCVHHDLKMLLVSGDFFQKESIFTCMFLGKSRTLVHTNLTEIFANVHRGYYYAHYFRFDLEN